MASKCNTRRGEAWLSAVQGNLDGAFTILSEDAAGNFTGIHSGGAITGECTGTHIKFWRPVANFRYEYSGKFNATKKKIKGKRKSLNKKTAVDEDWDSEKVVTKLGIRDPRKRR
jgi:hypothetical protein